MAVWIARRRWAAHGGDPTDIDGIAVWAVLAGLAGARAYHVLTDLDRFAGRWWHALAVWEGGLGIPGGLAAAVVARVVVARRRGLPVAQLLDVVAPAIPVAQAIGRLGNWFNQGLFGAPPTCPGGCASIPTIGPPATATWPPIPPRSCTKRSGTSPSPPCSSPGNAATPIKGPVASFALYVAGYALGRLWVEALRMTPPPASSASGSTSGSARSAPGRGHGTGRPSPRRHANARSRATRMAGSHDRARGGAAQHPTDRQSPDVGRLTRAPARSRAGERLSQTFEVLDGDRQRGSDPCGGAATAPSRGSGCTRLAFAFVPNVSPSSSSIDPRAPAAVHQR